MTSLTLPSFAKINWTLEILGKRPDGYHELRTLLQTIDIADELTFELIDTGIELACDHPHVPCDETNLVHKAARLLAEFAGTKRGVRVTINKRLPVAAGIGGGSSNAAVTLLALRKLWEVEIEPRDLFALAARLGADVPFFLLGGTCLGVGRGDELYAVAEFKAKHILLVNAGILVSTKEVYGALPPSLTKPGAIPKMPHSFAAVYAAGSAPNAFPTLHNDLEPVVFARQPLLSEVKQRLLQTGARGVLMSGSGATIFAIFDAEAARASAEASLNDTGWWSARARTLTRTDYSRAMQGLIE